MEGDYLINAQGEDVVAGIRVTKPLAELAIDMPEPHAEFAAIAERLEAHYRDMQDMEFTVEKGKLVDSPDSRRKTDGASRRTHRCRPGRKKG